MTAVPSFAPVSGRPWSPAYFARRSEREGVSCVRTLSRRRMRRTVKGLILRRSLGIALTLASLLIAFALMIDEAIRGNDWRPAGTRAGC